MPVAENDILIQLKELLFQEEKRNQESILNELNQVNDALFIDANFREKVEPIILEKLNEISAQYVNLYAEKVTESIEHQIIHNKERFVKALAPAMGDLIVNQVINAKNEIIDALFPIVSNLIAKKIEQSKDEMVDAMYPIISQSIATQFIQSKSAVVNDLKPLMAHTISNYISEQQEQIITLLYPTIGKLIKKYIASEFKMLRQNIQKQLDSVVSAKSWKNRFSSIVGKKKTEEDILRDYADYKIEDVYLIQKDTGFTIATYSTASPFEKDMLTGMLTAIKSFGEEALKEGYSEQIESIKYESYQLLIVNLPQYYFAVIISGIFNEHIESQIHEVLFGYSEKYIFNKIIEVTNEVISDYSLKLKAEIDSHFKKNI